MTKRQKPIKHTKPTEWKDLIETIVKILRNKGKINKANKELLLYCFKEMQKQIGLSIDYIRYLLISDKYENAHLKTFSEEANKETDKIIRKLVGFLSINGIKTEDRVLPTKRWCESVDLVKRPEQRLIRTFKV